MIAGTADSPAMRDARHKLITPAVYGANHKGLKQTVSFYAVGKLFKGFGVEFLTGLAEIGLYIHEGYFGGSVLLGGVFGKK